MVVDVDDAHVEGAAGEGEGAVVGEFEDHGAVSDWPFCEGRREVRKGAAVEAHSLGEG